MIEADIGFIHRRKFVFHVSAHPQDDDGSDGVFAVPAPMGTRVDEVIRPDFFLASNPHITVERAFISCKRFVLVLH